MVHLGLRKVLFHCYSSKTNLAKQHAEKYGFYFSIPANAQRDQGFQKLLNILPLDLILTETDSPYLSPTPGTRNSPTNVLQTIKLMADYRSLAQDEATQVVWNNFKRLFSKEHSIKPKS
jgi:TatD DNase family protein